MSQNSFRIEDWDFKFENIFDDESTRNDFGKYMGSVHNAEPFDFYVAVENLRRLRSAANQIRSARDIVQRHIVPGAKHEINIDKQPRSDILSLASRLRIHGGGGGGYDGDISFEQQRELVAVFNTAQNIVFREMKVRHLFILVYLFIYLFFTIIITNNID